MTKLFGTNGIRGDAEKFFTNDFCFKIASAYAFYLRNNLGINSPIALGYDPRPSSFRILKWITNGLLSQKLTVYDEGVVPSPCLTYFTKVSEAKVGIMITGSHVREDMNGLKLYIQGEEVSKIQEAEIEAVYEKLESILKPKAYEGLVKSETRAAEFYKNMLVKLADGNFKGKGVVLDAGNGTQSEIIPEVLNALGVKIFKINCDLSNPLMSRDTETSGAFLDLEKTVLSQSADFGIGFDSDGDRAVFVTNQGQMLTGDVSCSLIAKFGPGEYVVTPINTSSVVEHIGKKVERTKVGATQVAARMKEVGASYGFEANGGGISAEIFYGRDGGTTLIKMLKILRSTKKDLQTLVNELPRFYQVREKVDCPKELNEKIIAGARERKKDLNLNELDGLKFTYPNGDWILFRASGNAPEFRVFTESKDKQTAERLNKEGMDFVKSFIVNGKRES